MLLLTVSWYYLAANGKINNFPTYMAALAMIPLLALAPASLACIRKRLLYGVLVLIFYLSLTAIWSPNASVVTIGKSFANACLLLTFVLGIVIVSLERPSFLKWFLVILVLSATVSCAYSIYLHFALPDYHPLVEARLYALGRLSNPVVGALSYAMAAVICVNLVFAQTGWIRWIWFICLSVLFYGTLLTETRSAGIGLILAVPACILLQPGLTRRDRTLALTAFMAVILLTLAITWAGGYWQEILHRATSFRPEIWQRVLADTLNQHPVFGAGITANSKLEIDGILFQHAHSIYFATFFYGGVMGLGLLVGLIGMCLQQLWRRPVTDLSILAASSLLFACSALFFDGDRLLTKVSYLWMVFWLPVSFCLLASCEEGEICLD